MTIRTKVSLILVLVFLASGIFEYSIQHFIVLPSFQTLENENAIKDSKRVVLSIQREIDHINQICFDWSAWDDTYSFIKDVSKEYIEANLVFGTFMGHNLNLIYFYDHMGKVVWGKIYDLKTKEVLLLKKFASNGISLDDALSDFETNGKALNEVSNSGIIMTEKGIMLVASNPIITSNNKGPIRGTVVMGRFLDQGLIEAFFTQTKVKFQIHPIGIKDLTAKTNEIVHQLKDKSNFVIKNTSNDFLSIYTSMQDIKGKLVLLIEAEVARNISQKGKSTVNNAMFTIFFVALIGLISVIILLQWIVSKPLKKLTNHTLDVIKSADFSKIILMNRQDEMGALATSFNSMTQNVYDNSEKQQLLIQEKQNLINELQDALDKINTLSGLLPICASCKKIRDDKGYWNQIESYITDHSEATFSHGICQECAKKFYPDFDIYND
ncbi:MAG: HAMP domain-containing protein [Desulfobacteraceae bacterium]|nr:HAMP domain-containing protein [Desulfobacteraceae bacterium]